MKNNLRTLIAILFTFLVLIGCSSEPNSNKAVAQGIEQLIKPIHQLQVDMESKILNN